MKKHIYQLACTLMLCVLAGAGGCAANGKVLREQIANTEKSILAARDGNAATTAPLELKLAEDKLRSAKTAADQGAYDQARTMLEEAQVDADLARAKSESAKVQQLRDSIKALLREIEKNQKHQEIYYY